MTPGATGVQRARFRAATREDAHDVAMLHADSWRRYYRGAYSDSYLDGDLDTDRHAVWSARLAAANPATSTMLAETAAGLVGFAHTVVDHDVRWGVLLDNLHIRHSHQRTGVGSRLLKLSARPAIEQRVGLYLWVQEQNTTAQAFYRACGGTLGDRHRIDAPGGFASRLAGTPYKIRVAWTARQVCDHLAAPSPTGST